MVRRTVKEFAGRVPHFVDREELFAAGMLGLAQAQRTYRPDLGVPFEVHARSRVTGAILDDLRSRDSMSRSQRAAARIVIEAAKSIEATKSIEAAKSIETGGMADAPGDRMARIAARAGIGVAEVRRAFENLDRSTHLRHYVGLSDSEAVEVAGTHEADPLGHLLDRELLEQVRRCVAVLPTRLRLVIEGVFFEERQMQSIAAELGVTPSRVSQLCAEGLHHLRSALRALDHDVPVAATGRAS